LAVQLNFGQFGGQECELDPSAAFVPKPALAIFNIQVILSTHVPHKGKGACMKYYDLLQFYFERSNALQWYWTLYVVILGGLLAFSSLRKEPDYRTVILVSILYCCFAFKNLGAIEEVTQQRSAFLDTLKSAPVDPVELSLRPAIEPTLMPTDVPGVRNFHISCDVLVILTIWTFEWRRVRIGHTHAKPG
jgi:hypothetical protein